MTPEEQQQSTAHFDGIPVCEVGPDWYAPFQPWAGDPNAAVAFWAWQRPDTFTPVYERTPTDADVQR